MLHKKFLCVFGARAGNEPVRFQYFSSVWSYLMLFLQHISEKTISSYK